jgi:SAM-dependent methyltransferase
LRPRVETLLWRGFYEAASLGRGDLVSTMNYGYARGEQSTPEVDARSDRFGLQLYEAVVGEVELSGRDVLEVGCGRGGGASFIFERFTPRLLIGLDLAAAAVRRCRSRHARPGLEFVAGRADELPFPDASFDVILSVESSHCYPNVPRFLAEVRRALRPDGLLVLADFRRTDATPSSTDGATQDLQSFRAQIADAGFRVVEEDDITSNVVRALDLNTPAMRARIERRVPRFLQHHALQFAAVSGTPIYRDFADGRLPYLRLVLRRAGCRAAQTA